MNNDGNWHYLQQGLTVGPATRAALEGMIRAGTIRSDTLVWPGSGDWVAAGSSSLAPLFAGGVVPMVPFAGASPPMYGSGSPAMPQGKYEPFVFAELTPRLGPSERFELTALLWTGSMMRLVAFGAAAGAIGAMVGGRQTMYFAAATDRRLFLIRTKVGLLALKAVNLGVVEIRYDDINHVSTGGTLNHKTTTIVMKDGSTTQLRLNTMGRAMSGQGQFQDRFPQLVAQRHAAMGGR